MSKLKAIAVVCAILIAAASAFVAVSVMKTRQQAKMLISVLRDLAVSRSPNDTFDSFQWKYGRARFKHSDACSMHFCTYEADVSNEVIARLHLVPYTEMKVWFEVENGRLVTAMVEYRSALRGPNSPVIHVQQGVCARGCGVRFDLNPHGTTKQIWNGFVEFNPRATQVEKDAALALNLSCFFRIGGCKDITELLPAVWQRSGSGAVTSRLVGLSQRLEESHGFPSPDDLGDF
jgi:hypothetical protein